MMNLFLILCVIFVSLVLFIFLVVSLVFLESKVVGFFSVSWSVSRMNYLFWSHFAYDMLKLMFKESGLSSSLSESSKTVYVMGLSTGLGISFYILPLNVFGQGLLLSFLLYLGFDVFSFIIKLQFVKECCGVFSVHKFSIYSLLKFFVFVESMSFLLFMFVFLLLGGLKGMPLNDAMGFGFCGGNLLVFIYKFMVLLYLLILLTLYISMKSFSVPFDYVELESELVGGLSLELGGLSFSLWAIVEYSSSLIYMKVVIGVLYKLGGYSYFFLIVYSSIVFFLLYLVSVFGSSCSFKSSYSLLLVFCFGVLLSFLLFFCFIFFYLMSYDFLEVSSFECVLVLSTPIVIKWEW